MASRIMLGNLKVVTKSYHNGYPSFPLTFNLLVMIPQLASEIYFYIVNRCITKEPKYVSGWDFGLCWVWQGFKNAGRYGSFSIPYELPAGKFYVHVASASKAMNMVVEFSENDVYKKGIITHHTCFDPECCNPEHLVAISRADHASLVSLSPRPKSILNKSHKLHIDEKKIIKRMVRDGWRIKDVAFHFRVSVTTIYNTVANEKIPV
jgi:hypothetical protein